MSEHDNAERSSASSEGHSPSGNRVEPGEIDDALVDGDATFGEPWQARAFALAVTVTDEDGDGVGEWTEFQKRLVAEIEEAESPAELASRDEPPELDGDETEYYSQWLAALEDLLVSSGIDAEALRERALAFERGDRDAHEFVEGDPHEHADDLPAGHADGSHGHTHDH